jgi:adenosine deaminase
MLVDLHVHLRGTVNRDTVIRLAKRNDVTLPGGVLENPRFGWHDFRSFLQTYDLVTSVVKTARDLEEITLAYLADSADRGGIYVEFMLSPPDLIRSGIAFVDQLAAIGSAAEQAREELGISCRLVATAVRHLGPEAAITAARMTMSRANDILVGFGLTGDETQFPITDFEEAFRIAREEGLKATAHAGEHLPADSILEAVERLRLDRVGHGVRAAESQSVVGQLAAAKIPLEICIASNLSLGLYPDLASHPIRALAEGGCVIVLGTDDPGFFETTIDQEYDAAGNAHSSLTWDTISTSAINAAFCDADTKADLLANLHNYHCDGSPSL